MRNTIIQTLCWSFWGILAFNIFMAIRGYGFNIDNVFGSFIIIFKPERETYILWPFLIVFAIIGMRIGAQRDKKTIRKDSEGDD